MAGLVLTGRLRSADQASAAPLPDAQATAATPAPRAVTSGPDFTEVAARTVNAVTNISSLQPIRRQNGPFENDPFFQYFFGNMDVYGGRNRGELSLGSGVVVSSDGYVLTNVHVLGAQGRGTEVRVALSDKRELRAQVVGADQFTDIALVKIDAHNLPTIPWGDSSKLKVAEWVLAIGNPYQLSQTVTLGIVSALRRSNIGAAGYEDFIQTDAAINPGNSGGALINSRGELIGINTAIYSQSGGYQGIGFAVPSNLARKVMDDLIKYGEVKRGYLGYFETLALNPELAAEVGISRTRGVLVSRMDRTERRLRVRHAARRCRPRLQHDQYRRCRSAGTAHRRHASGLDRQTQGRAGGPADGSAGSSGPGRPAPRRHQLLTGFRLTRQHAMPNPSAFSLLDGQPQWSEIALVIGVGFLVASIFSTIAARLVRRTIHAIYGEAPTVDASVKGPTEIVRIISFLLVFVVTVLPMLDTIGERFDTGLDGRTAFHWIVGSGLRIALIITIAWLVVRMIATSTSRLERQLAGTGAGRDDRLKRAQTLGGLIQNVSTAVIAAGALLMVLRELNVDIVPMLTGAGIAGVALGFGAQWLVRDVIAGFFLILEDQVRVGDSVVINGQGGTIEAINLRTTILRDVEGAVLVFPNGAIATLANKTRDYAYALVDLAVDFQEDTDKVIQILRETAATLQAEPAFAGGILEPLEVLGIESFRDGQVVVRSRMKAVPQRQGEIARELRRRFQHALNKAGVDLPPVGLHTMLSRKSPPA